ncbi:DUF6514 family protein [Pseudoclostridium thermosuccinogenes]|uniref:DUF6514 family protein n=1 Tax=Clostridium thermosuccinogenes TaxID=84032 RepID=UPI000CCBFDCA|nr:DUF6514 family protein [Pseudoclostridium thermosuccinogenes]PNT93041.1 hypothetical protein CDQ83_05720 [Pseudoclostridium thermosuccinogenes]
MINRRLEKSLELSMNDGLSGDCASIKLEYYILENEISDMDELTGKIAYGIEIVKKVDGKNDEVSTVKNLSCCKESVIRILDKLACNTVTPVGMPYVLDDMLGVLI